MSKKKMGELPDRFSPFKKKERNLIGRSKMVGLVRTVLILFLSFFLSSASFAGVEKVILFDLSESITGNQEVYNRAFEILQRETSYFYFTKGNIEAIRKMWNGGDIPLGRSVAIVGFAAPECITTLAEETYPQSAGYNFRRVFLASQELLLKFLNSLKNLKCDTSRTDIYNALAYVLATYPEARRIVIISDMRQTSNNVWMLDGRGKGLRIYLINPVKASNIQRGYEEGLRLKSKFKRLFRKGGFSPIEVRLVNIIIRR